MDRLLSLATVLQFLAGLTSLYSLKTHGDISLKGPVVGLVAQGFWLAVVVTTPAWGMLPMILLFIFFNLRNLVRWYRAGVRWRSTPLTRQGGR